jgi:predicted tellurium resistance membrane protein TerC
MLPVIVICFQFFLYSVSLHGEEKQKKCRTLGIIYMSFGIISLASRSMLFTVTGLVLIMMGLRLIAYGLDRINKKIFIDRYDED